MMDHNCGHKKAHSLFMDLHSESWRVPCSNLEQVFRETKKKKINEESEVSLKVRKTFPFVTKLEHLL